MRLGLTFLAGMLVGLASAIFLGLGGSRFGKDGDAGAASGKGAAALSPGSGGMSSKGGESRPRDWKGRGRGILGSSAQATAFMDYLSELSRIDGVGEINFMELLRHGSLLTRMSEREVFSLLVAMRERAEKRDEPDGELDQIVEAMLFARFAELNGPEAMRMARSGEMGKRWEGDEDELMALGMSSWVEADPEGAAAWFEGILRSDDPDLREMLDNEAVQSAFFAAMARADAARARELMRGSPGGLPYGAAAIARSEKSVEGLQGLLDTAAGAARVEVLQELCRRDAGAGADWLEEKRELDNHDELVAVVAEFKLREDPAAGADWYMRQDVGDEFRAQRLVQVVDSWADRDAEAAGKWLARQLDTPGRDPAEAALASLAVRNGSDWKAGLAWAAEVGDPELRGGALREIFQSGWDGHSGAIDAKLEAAAAAAGFEAEMEAFISRETGSE